MTPPLIGCGQITWHNNDEVEALTDIAATGYDGAPPKIRPEVTSETIKELFAPHALRPAPPYFGGSFWDIDQEESLLAAADRLGRLTSEIGCTELYVAAGGGGYQAPSGAARSAAAGHVTSADSMSDQEFDQFASALNAFSRTTLQYGVRSCFHNHVGTVIETREELDRLMASTDEDAVFLGIDTGHLAWGGADVVETIGHYGPRVLTLHLKDIVEQVRAQGATEKWDYDSYTKAGIFTELGMGCVDFVGIKRLLDQADFEGWLIVETDVTQQPSARESARISREYLAGLGW